MKVVGYAYPWDVAEPGFMDRVRSAGIDEVAVATSYHSTRAATPWSTTSTAVDASHAALYRPQRDEAWAGRRLRPGTPSWLSDPDPAGTAIARLLSQGLPVSAWVVLNHDSRLGEQQPDVTVLNCFGEGYPWAMCPSRPEVREHAATLTAESVRGLDVSTVVLEACGQLGVVHQCRHEKTDGAWSPAVVQLLSVCCCDACAWGSAQTSHSNHWRCGSMLPRPVYSRRRYASQWIWAAALQRRWKTWRRRPASAWKCRRGSQH